MAMDEVGNTWKDTMEKNKKKVYIFSLFSIFVWPCMVWLWTAQGKKYIFFIIIIIYTYIFLYIYIYLYTFFIN